MATKKKENQNPRPALINPEDPFGIRSVTLGGDTPSLHSEIKFISRRNGSESSGEQDGNGNRE